jgi:hypothetical protein
MAEVGFEPTCPCEQGILSPQRLPFRHSAHAPNKEDVVFLRLT